MINIFITLISSFCVLPSFSSLFWFYSTGLFYDSGSRSSSSSVLFPVAAGLFCTLGSSGVRQQIPQMSTKTTDVVWRIRPPKHNSDYCGGSTLKHRCFCLSNYDTLALRECITCTVCCAAWQT